MLSNLGERRTSRVPAADEKGCRLRVERNGTSQIKKSILDFPTKSIKNTLTVSVFVPDFLRLAEYTEHDRWNEIG